MRKLAIGLLLFLCASTAFAQSSGDVYADRFIVNPGGTTFLTPSQIVLAPATGNSSIAIGQNSDASDNNFIIFKNGSGKHGWLIDANFITSDAFSITPSTTLGGTTFTTPTMQFFNDGTAKITNNLGIHIAPTATQQINTYSGSITDTTGTDYDGAFNYVRLAPSSNSAASIQGISVEAQLAATGTAAITGFAAGVSGLAVNSSTGSGVVSNMYGLNFAAYNGGSSRVANEYGAFISWGSSSSGNVTTAYGINLAPFNSGAGTISTNYGLAVMSPNGGATILNYGAKIFNMGATGTTHAYGLNIAEASGASSTNISLSIGTEVTGASYSLYNASTVQSYFGGRIGIGASTPGFQVDIAGLVTQFPSAINVQPSTHATSRRAGMNFDMWTIGQDLSGNGTKDFFIAGPPGTDIYVSSTGKVGINNTTPGTYQFAVQGTAQLAGLTTSAGLQTAVLCLDGSNQVISDSVACLASSGRYKQNVRPMLSGLSEVMRLQPVAYRYKPDFNKGFQSNPNFNGEQVGLIAEEVADIDPRLTTVDIDGPEAGTPRTVRYENMVALLVRAIQEQQAQIDQLKQQLAILTP